MLQYFICDAHPRKRYDLFWVRVECTLIKARENRLSFLPKILNAFKPETKNTNGMFQLISLYNKKEAKNKAKDKQHYTKNRKLNTKQFENLILKLYFCIFNMFLIFDFIENKDGLFVELIIMQPTQYNRITWKRIVHVTVSWSLFFLFMNFSLHFQLMSLNAPLISFNCVLKVFN